MLVNQFLMDDDTRADYNKLLLISQYNGLELDEDTKIITYGVIKSLFKSFMYLHNDLKKLDQSKIYKTPVEGTRPAMAIGLGE